MPQIGLCAQWQHAQLVALFDTPSNLSTLPGDGANTSSKLRDEALALPAISGNAALWRRQKESTSLVATHTMTDPPAEPTPPPAPAAPRPPADGPPVVSSQEILQGRRELWIDHDGEIYRLRVTSRGKLYLTK